MSTSAVPSMRCLLALAATTLACAGAPPTPATPPAASNRSQIAPPTGDVHDFEYFAGGWKTVQRRLKTRGAGASDWEEFPATLCMTPYLGGSATVDEIFFPTKGWSGLTVRTFDPEKRRWSIYWVSSRSGKLDTPVVGGFQGAHGEFFGEDEDGGRAVTVRYAWTKLDRDHARWEQSFSYDGSSWETNWTADFVRADAADVCDHGRPRR